MMTKLGMMAFISASLLGGFASAQGGGSEAGNGGSSIVCQNPQGQITSVELLDFYEARTQRGIKIDLGPATDTVAVKLQLAVDRLMRLDLDFATLLKFAIADFDKNSKFFSGVRLIEIPDSQNLFIPMGCQQEQIAIRRSPAVPEDRLYNINQDLWDHLDNDGKAGLILHEVLYYLADHATDSKMVRYLVSKLASAEADTWDLRGYVDVLRQLHFTSVYYKGNFFVIDDHYPEFLENDVFLGGPLHSGDTILVQNQKIDPSFLEYGKDGAIAVFQPRTVVNLQVDGQPVWFQQGQKIQISSDQVLSGFAVYSSQNVFKRPSQYELQVKAMDKKPVEIHFDETGRLNLCQSCVGTVTLQGVDIPIGIPAAGADPAPFSYFETSWDWGERDLTITLAQPVSLQVAGQQVTFEGKLQWAFNQNSGMDGWISYGNLAGESLLQVGDGKRIQFSQGYVGFFKSGRLHDGTLAEQAVLTGVDGQTLTYLPGMAVNFAEDGKVNYALMKGRKKIQRK